MLFWIVICIIALVIDIFTASLLSIWFTLGSLAAIVFSLFGLSFVFQVIVFVIVTILGLIFGYPVVKRLVKDTVPKFKSLESSNLGQTIICKEDIIDGSGKILLNGALWRIEIENHETVLKGEKLELLELKGNVYFGRKASSTLSKI